MPSALVDKAQTDPSPALGNWLAVLAQTVDDLAQRWRLEVGPPFQPGGQTAWVAPVRDAEGRELVLKVGWVHFEADQEADR